jgi:Kef-type K+ transport system membrane component KefB
MPFTFFLTNEVLVWTLMMCLTVTLSEGSVHVWESLVLQVKIISIWLLFVIWVPRWVFSLGKSSLNSWDSKLSVVPLA